MVSKGAAIYVEYTEYKKKGGYFQEKRYIFFVNITKRFSLVPSSLFVRSGSPMSEQGASEKRTKSEQKPCLSLPIVSVNL